MNGTINLNKTARFFVFRTASARQIEMLAPYAIGGNSK